MNIPEETPDGKDLQSKIRNQVDGKVVQMFGVYSGSSNK